MQEGLDPAISKNVKEWLDGPYDEKTKKEISELLKKDPKALIDAFYTTLSFGTGGLRGVMGVGTNRMNNYTIQIATQGLANYILKNAKEKNPSVFIGFDSRHHSQEFAAVAASVFAANSIRVYLLKDLRPTPFISFGCRYKKCTAAVMITASHNPAEYNGYKVYWSDGAQVVPPHDTGIMQEVNAIKNISQVKMTTNINHPLIEMVDETLDEAYIDAIRPLQHFPEENRKTGNSLKITYTSLHGTGITLAPAALKDWGFNSIHYVEEQIKPDGDFPTVKFPNPEFKEALELGIKKLLSTQSDLLIATDPDADRMGVVVLHHGKPEILTGNDIASICVHYLCETLNASGKMPKNGAFVTTIVSTELQKAIATSYHKPCFEVLTGFKYIGEKIHLWETQKDGHAFLFGAEESYGYLIGTHSRDKDAIVSACLIAEIALVLKKKGKTLLDALYELYKTYGIYREKQFSLNFKGGKDAMQKMDALMSQLRKNLPSGLCGKDVVYIEDYETGIRHLLKDGKKETLTLPKSDVLLFRLDDETKLVIRPSGTEPKLKIYASVHERTFSSIKEGISQAEERLDTLIETMKKELS